MKKHKLLVGLLAALALTVLTGALLLAAPSEPGKELKQELGAPIPPRPFIKAHSEEWNDAYFDKLTRTQPVLHIEQVPHGKVRGGLAEQQALNAAPEPRKAGVQAHSDAWNDYYFDRNVNSHIVAQTGEYQYPFLWRGGLAKGAAEEGK
jgi:hypothetical protein